MSLGGSKLLLIGVRYVFVLLLIPRWASSSSPEGFLLARLDAVSSVVAPASMKFALERQALMLHTNIA